MIRLGIIECICGNQKSKTGCPEQTKVEVLEMLDGADLHKTTLPSMLAFVILEEMYPRYQMHSSF